MVSSFDVIFYTTNKSLQIIFFPDQDALIFNFHHALFDFPSMDIFLHDLNQAYTTGQLSNNDNTALRYIDCNYKYFFSIINTSSFSTI